MTITGVTNCAILAILRHRLRCNTAIVPQLRRLGFRGVIGCASACACACIWPPGPPGPPPKPIVAGGSQAYLGAHPGARPSRSAACGYPWRGRQWQLLPQGQGLPLPLLEMMSGEVPPDSSA